MRYQDDGDMHSRLRSVIYGTVVARSATAALELGDLLDELDDEGLRIVQAAEALAPEVIALLTTSEVKAEWAA